MIHGTSYREILFQGVFAKHCSRQISLYSSLRINRLIRLEDGLGMSLIRPMRIVMRDDYALY